MINELKKHFTFPFDPHDFQEMALAEITMRDCGLLKFKVGLGKTFTSILAALYYSLEAGIEQILILCPPILLDQWYDFLNTITGIPDICLYRGTPGERSLMDLEDSVILVSYNIFRGKNDHKKFIQMAKKRNLCIIADELSLKSLKSQTYRKIKQLLYRKLRITTGDRPFHKLIALNATPLSDLSQVYNWCSLFAPGLYGSKRLFELAHVAKQDHWGNVTEWINEDVMGRNMGLFSVDTDKDVKLPPLVETVVPYELSIPHRKLYWEVEQAELDNLPEEKIELALNSMFSTLQRLVLVPSEFGLDIVSPVMEFIDGYLDQLGDDGILIYTRHVIVSEMIAKLVPDCAAIYGGVSKAVRETAFNDLKSGKIKRLVGNIESLGTGLNLQMLNHVIFVELPFRDDKLTQSIGRLHRQGQQNTCFASYPMAKSTLQYQIYYKLLKNQEDLSRVLKTKRDVKAFLS